MTNLYITATEHINKHPYEVMIQPHIAISFGPKFNGKHIAPLYEPFDAAALQKSRISIAKMVEYFVSKSSFTIINDRDVIEILHQIDAYVAEVYGEKSVNPEIEKYLEKILKLRDRIYFLFRRVLNLHPQWKTAYHQQIGVFNVMAELYRAIGMQIAVPETLMESLRICPTIREYEKLKADEMTIPENTSHHGLYDGV